MGFPNSSTAFPMPIPPKPPWYSTPTAIASLPTAAPNCNSLIASPTDTPATENRKNKSYDKIKNNNNDRPNDDNDNDNVVDCFPQEQPWYSFSFPAYTHNPTQAPRKPAPNRTGTKQSAHRDRPDDDHNNNDNDVDCFPRQDKQPVLLQQDIPPTAPTANNTLPSLIESFTDTRPAQ